MTFYVNFYVVVFKGFTGICGFVILRLKAKNPAGCGIGWCGCGVFIHRIPNDQLLLDHLRMTTAIA